MVAPNKKKSDLVIKVDLGSFFFKCSFSLSIKVFIFIKYQACLHSLLVRIKYFQCIDRTQLMNQYCLLSLINMKQKILVKCDLRIIL